MDMEALYSGFVETVSDGTGVKLAENGRMIEIGDDTYGKVAASLLEALGDGYYYNGSMDVDGVDFYSTFTATLIVYREPERLPEGRTVQVVSDVVPVWWEFATVVPGKGEVLNDFSFGRLKDTVMAMR